MGSPATRGLPAPLRPVSSRLARLRAGLLGPYPTLAPSHPLVRSTPRHPRAGLAGAPLARRALLIRPRARAPGRPRRAFDAAPRDEAERGVRALPVAARHAFGWGFPRGGSQRLADALAERSRARRRDPHREPGRRAASRRHGAGRRRAAPAASARRRSAPARYARALRATATARASSRSTGRSTARSRGSRGCPAPATVHLGGTLEEIAESERLRGGRHAERPFVLLAQPDCSTTRGPAGQHTAWAYCHVPTVPRRT